MIDKSTMKDLEAVLSKISESDAPDLQDRLELVTMLLDPNLMSLKEIQDYVDYQKTAGKTRNSISMILVRYLCSKANSASEEPKGIVPYVKKVLSLIESYLENADDPEILNPSLRIKETENELNKIEKKIENICQEQEKIDKELSQLIKQKKLLDDKKQKYEQDLRKYEELKGSTESLEKQITEFEECMSKISIADMEERNQKLIDNFKQAKEQLLNDKSLVGYLFNVKKAVEAYQLVNEIEDVISILKNCEIDNEIAGKIEFSCTDENIKPIRSAKLKLEAPFKELEKELKIIIEKMIQE